MKLPILQQGLGFCMTNGDVSNTFHACVMFIIALELTPGEFTGKQNIPAVYQ